VSRLLDDQPVDARQDRLRLTRYLDIIDKRVLHKDDSLLREGKSPPPFVVGVFGRWGTGKTSLLKMLAERLEAQSKQIEAKRPRRLTLTDVLNGPSRARRLVARAQGLSAAGAPEARAAALYLARGPVLALDVPAREVAPVAVARHPRQVR